MRCVSLYKGLMCVKYFVLIIFHHPTPPTLSITDRGKHHIYCCFPLLTVHTPTVYICPRKRLLSVTWGQTPSPDMVYVLPEYAVMSFDMNDIILSPLFGVSLALYQKTN